MPSNYAIYRAYSVLKKLSMPCGNDLIIAIATAVDEEWDLIDLMEEKIQELSLQFGDQDGK